jgi:hypothetical protein
MKRIPFIVLAALLLLAGPSPAETCYQVIEYYAPDVGGTYHLLASDDNTFFVKELGAWGFWGVDPTDKMIYFQFRDEKGDHPYHFLSGTRKAGFCQSETGNVGYYSLKKVKPASCNNAGMKGVASVSIPSEED